MWREESQPWAFPTHPNSHEWLLLQEEPESCISHNVTLFSLQSYKHQIPFSLSKLFSGIIPCNCSHCAKDLREITVLATERGKAWPNSCTCIVRLPCPSLHFHVPSGVSNSLLAAREPIPLSSHSYYLPPSAFCGWTWANWKHFSQKERPQHGDNTIIFDASDFTYPKCWMEHMKSKIRSTSASLEKTRTAFPAPCCLWQLTDTLNFRHPPKRHCNTTNEQTKIIHKEQVKKKTTSKELSSTPTSCLLPVTSENHTKTTHTIRNFEAAEFREYSRNFEWTVISADGEKENRLWGYEK